LNGDENAWQAEDLSGESPAAARNHVEADRSRADNYYLAEGTGFAQRYVASPALGDRPPVPLAVEPLSGDVYERWVAGYAVETGKPKGRLRTDSQGVRFVEVAVRSARVLTRSGEWWSSWRPS